MEKKVIDSCVPTAESTKDKVPHTLILNPALEKKAQEMYAKKAKISDSTQ